MLGIEVILAFFARGSTFFEDLQGRLAFQRLRIHVGVAQDEQTDDLQRTKETGLAGRLSAVPVAHFTVPVVLYLGVPLDAGEVQRREVVAVNLVDIGVVVDQ